MFHDTIDKEISVQTDNASLVPYVQSKDGTNDETNYERPTMRDISRGQNKKKKRWTQICFGGKIDGVMGSSGRVGTCKIVFPLTKKSGRVFKSPI